MAGSLFLFLGIFPQIIIIISCV
jgi:GTP pyrophosphokinase